MSNLNDIYTANPLTSIPLDALLYILDNPGQTGGDDDAGINANDLLAQIIGTRIDGIKLTWNGAASIDVGTGLLVAENRDVINITTAITKSGLSLSNSTWYHVYAYLDSGTPAAEVVTTAPVAWKGTAYSKTGDTSRRYVGSVKTDGSGNVIPFLHNPATGLIAYYGVNIGSLMRVLNAGQQTTATAVDCSGFVPVTSRFGLIKFYKTETTQTAVAGPSSGVSTSAHHLSLFSAAAALMEASMPLTSSQTFYYLFGGAPTGSLTADVIGYYLDR